MRLSSRSKLGLIDLVGVLIIFTFVFERGSPAVDPGTGWHLRSGQWVVTTGTVPHSDPFLAFSPPAPWVHNQWLADAVFWLVYDLGSWPLVHVGIIGLVLLAFCGILSGFLKNTVRSPFAVFVALAFAVVLGSLQWVVRPVIFSYVLFPLVYAFAWNLYTKPKTSPAQYPREIVYSFLLFSVWANLHPAFVLGLFVLAVFSAAALFSTPFSGMTEAREQARRLVLITVAGILGSLLNPYGIALYANIFGLTTSRYFMNLNVEWHSPDFHQHIFWPFLLAVLASLSLGRGRSRADTIERFLVIVFMVLSLIYRRYIPFFGVVFAKPLASALSDFVYREESTRMPAMASAIARIDSTQIRVTRALYSSIIWCLILGYTAWFGFIPFQDRSYSDIDVHFPRLAVDALEPSAQGARIFHTPDWGGYLTWRFWPLTRPFIDDRNQLNTTERYQEFLQADGLKEGWADVLERYQFEWSLLRPESPLASMLETKDDWTLFYEDKTAKLFRKEFSESSTQ